MFLLTVLHFRRLANFEDRDLSTFRFRIDSNDRVRVYICLYRTYSANTETDQLMEHLQSAIDDMLSQIPSAEVVILGDFNAHNGSWLGSPPTTRGGLHLTLLWQTDCPNWLSRLRDSRTWTNNHNASLLDLLLTSHPEQYQVVVDAPLGLLTTAWYGVSCPLSAAAADHPQLVASGTTSQQIGMGWNFIFLAL